MWHLLADGRRPIYLFTSLVFVIGSAGLAAAQNIPSLLFWRFIQSMGSSLGPSLGAAVIGDIFTLVERGGATGFCFAASKLFIHDLRMY
jgi:MFS family permease